MFFLSGAAGLLYEVVWVRTLGLVVGGEAVASHAVLSAYFVGMAAGAFVLGRRVDRAASPLRAYAGLELGVAAAGLYSLGALAIADRIVPRLSSGESGPALGALAFLVGLLAFLPATFFMGATLPALVRGSIAALRDTPKALGRLYALNTLGAMAGSLLTGFALLAVIGSRATVMVAAVLNLCAAAVAWRMARVRGAGADPTDAPGPPAAAGSEAPKTTAKGKAGRRKGPPAKPAPAGVLDRRAILVALGLAGFAAIAFEMAAVRVLAATFESTVYSFAATLGAYLGGIVIASAAFSRWPIDASRPGRPPLIVAGSALALALGAELLRASGPLYAALVDAFEDTFRGRVLAELLTALVLVLPAAVPTTLVFCALAPLTVRAADRAAGEVGVAYMANTLGCALAPVVVGLGALPALQSRGAVWAAVAALGAGALVLRPPMPALAGVAASAVVAVMLPPHLYTWPVTEGHRRLYSHEGAGAAVAVEERGGSRVLRTGNHYFEGGSASVFAEMRQGHLPMLLHPTPRRALVLGVGTGTTLGAVGKHPGVEADGVELLSEVIGVLAYFNATNGGVLDNRSVRLHQADARSFVRAAAAGSRRYDVIVADLFHPQQSGVGNLYTREHFAAARAALAPGGLFVQWLSLYELPPDGLGAIVRSFLSVFPAATGWYAHFNAKTGILGLAGAERPLALDWDAALDRIGDPRLRDALAGSVLDKPLEFFGSFVADRSGLERLGGRGPLNTDDRPLVEYAVPRGHSSTDMALRLRGLDLVRGIRTLPGPETLRYAADPSAGEKRREQLASWQAAIDALIRGQRAIALDDPAGAIAAYKDGALAAPEFTVNYAMLRDAAIQMAQAGRANEARNIFAWVVEHDPGNLEAAQMLGRFQPVAPAR